MIVTKDAPKASRCAFSALSQRSNRAAYTGPSEPSPTTPPRIATAFKPICTTVK